jgi:transaldolase
MKQIEQLRALGQSLWLDNISRSLLTSGTLSHYVKDLGVTGLTSNPTIFEHAIGETNFYDSAINTKRAAGKSGEALFLELALEDLTQAADIFSPIHNATGGVDGWVSLEVSPLLADNTSATIKAANDLYARAKRANIFIKIPGTPAGIPAIEEAIFTGVPVNVTLLFSREQYLAAAGAYLRGIDRRLSAGRDPRVASVASLFVSRWDVAVAERVSPGLRNRLGIAIARRTYKAYRDLLTSAQSERLIAAGARPQRLLWASTGSKDPAASDVLYVESLAAPDTINTMPDKTLLAFADHGGVATPMPLDAAAAEAVLAEFTRAGINLDALGEQLQREGAAAFAKSWRSLLQRLDAKSAALPQAQQA